jgi:hypothetical protein
MARVLGFTGGACLLIVALTHVAERWDILPGMRWGRPDSPGRYLDLFSAIIGVALLVVAFVTSRSRRNRILRLAKPLRPRERR